MRRDRAKPTPKLFAILVAYDEAIRRMGRESQPHSVKPFFARRDNLIQIGEDAVLDFNGIFVLVPHYPFDNKHWRSSRIVSQ
jgi:hypothetical protein